MDGDDRYIPGEPTNFKDVQEMLRDIWEVIHTLEGRTGPINLRNNLSVTGSGAFTGDLSTEGSVTLDNFIQVNEREFDRLGVLTPAVSPVGSSRIYQDPTSDTLKVSQNGAAYQDLVVAGYTPPANFGKGCRIFNSANQALAHDAVVTLSFDSEIFDNDNMHSGGSPTRITFTTAGVYTVGGSVQISNTDGDTMWVYSTIRLNGTTLITEQAATNDQGATGFNGRINPNTVYRFAAGDYVELQVRQNNADADNEVAAFVAGTSPQFWAFGIAT